MEVCMVENYNMEEIKNAVQEYKESETNNNVQIVDNNEIVGVTPNIVTEKLSKIIYKTDSSKSVTEQIEEAAEVGATVKAVENEDVREKMADAKGEQLIETVKEKAASARVGRLKAETEEQIAKKEQNEAMLGIFNANKHYPEWFRKIVVAIFAPFYLILLFVIGTPTAIVRFTLECIDGIIVRYEDVDERRKPKVRITFLLILILGIISAVLFPLLKYFKII